MANPQQNKVQNKIKQFEKHINILQDKLKQLKCGEKQIAKMENRSELTGKKKINKWWKKENWKEDKFIAR